MRQIATRPSDERPDRGFAFSLSFFFFVAGMLPIVDPNEAQRIFQMQRAVLYALSFGTLVWAAGLHSIWRALLNLPLPAPLVALMVWAALSYTWSVDPYQTLVRCAESTVCMIYGAVFTTIALDRFGSFSSLAAVLARAVILVAVVGLIGNVLLHGEALHLFVNKWMPDRPRLQLLHSHPLHAGDNLSFAIVCVLFKAALRLRDAVVLAGLFYLLLLTDSTGARLTLPLIVVLSWLSGRGARSGNLKIGLLLIAAVGATAMIALFGSALLETRGAERFLTLTGRLKLWDTILSSELVGSFVGTGFDASSVLIRELFNKDYHSHNEYISSVVELGYIGFALHMLMLATWLFTVLRAGKGFPLAIFVYIVVIGIINPVILTKPVPIFFFMISFIGSLHLLRGRSRAAAARGGFPSAPEWTGQEPVVSGLAGSTRPA